MSRILKRVGMIGLVYLDLHECVWIEWHTQMISVIAEDAAKRSKMFTRRYGICLSARLERVDIVDFGRVFTQIALQWSILLVNSEKYPLSTIGHFPKELWPKKSDFPRFIWHLDIVCLFRSDTPGIAGGSLLFLSTLASRPNVYNAQKMVAVRFFNLEYGPIEFLTDGVQDFQSSESFSQTVSNTLNGNTGSRYALLVCTTSMGCVREVLFALGYSEWKQEL